MNIKANNYWKIRKRGEYFIYLIIGLWLGTEVLVSSNLKYILWWEKEIVNTHMAITVLVLTVIQMVFFQRYKFKDLIVIVLVSVPVLIATLNSNYNIIVSSWLFIIASKYVDIEKIVKIVFMILLIEVLLVIMLNGLGYIPDTVMYRGQMIRHSCGFSHPNYFGAQIFHLTVCWMYIRRNNINICDYILLGFSAYFVYKVPNSQSSYYSIIILLTITIIYEYVKKNEIMKMHFIDGCIVIAIALNFFSVLVSYIGVKGNTFLSMIDKFVSMRFSHCHTVLHYYGIKMLGQNFQNIVARPGIGWHYRFYLDNGYMAILIRYGVIVYILFSFIYTITMIYFRKRSNYYILIVFLLYSIYGIMENNFFAMSQNIFLLACAYPIFSKEIDDGTKAIRKFRIVWN